MPNKTLKTARSEHFKKWYHRNITEEEIGQNPEIWGLMKENKAVDRWKVGDFFKHNKQNERKHEFKSGKVRQDLAKCREQFGQQKRHNRGVGQKIIYRLVK